MITRRALLRGGGVLATMGFIPAVAWATPTRVVQPPKVVSSQVVDQALAVLDGYGFILDEQAGVFGYCPGALDTVDSLHSTVRQAVESGEVDPRQRAEYVVDIEWHLVREIGPCWTKRLGWMMQPRDQFSGQSLREVMTAGQDIDLHRTVARMDTVPLSQIT